VENIILKLLQAADGDVQKAQQGIIYMTKSTRLPRKMRTRRLPAMFRRRVQQALLKILEGTVANVPPQGGRKHPHQEFTPSIPPTFCLFVAGLCGVRKDYREARGTRALGFHTDTTPATVQRRNTD